MWETETAAQGDEPAHAEHTLARLTRVARPGSVIFLLSDFRNLGERFERNLRQLAGHCDVFLVHLFDTVEVDLPPPGRYRIHSETGTVAINTDSDAARRRYHVQFEERRALLEKFARFPSVVLLECATTEEPRAILAERFESR